MPSAANVQLLMGSWAHLLGFLIEHGYALILPLAVIEGPILAIVAGFLSARGYLDWYWVLYLLVCGDLIGDFIYYWIGRFTRMPLAGLGRRYGLTAEKANDFERRLIQNSTRMLLVGKWTHAIGGVVLIGAGMVRLPLLRFMLVNLLGTLPKAAVLLAAGYFAGSYYPMFADHLVLGSLLLFVIGTTAVFLILRRRGDIKAGGVAP